MSSSEPVETLSANSTEVSLFAAATETFSQKNTNCSIAESMERCKPIMELAKQHNIRVRGYVSVALGCPYEGPDVDPLGRAVDIPLWSERFDHEALLRIKATLGSYWFSALYQCRPQPAEGGVFKRSWFRYWHIEPDVPELYCLAC